MAAWWILPPAEPFHPRGEDSDRTNPSFLGTGMQEPIWVINGFYQICLQPLCHFLIHFHFKIRLSSLCALRTLARLEVDSNHWMENHHNLEGMSQLLDSFQMVTGVFSCNMFWAHENLQNSLFKLQTILWIWRWNDPEGFWIRTSELGTFGPRTTH